MANHEVNYKCVRCGNEYDARLHGVECPECQRINSTPVSCVRDGNNDLFYIAPCALLGCGFFVKTSFDSDQCDFDNLKIVTYTKPIAQGLRIEVVFFFEAKIKGIYELKESNVDLVVADGVLPLGVKSLHDIIRISDSLIKSINLKKYAARCC